MGELFGLAYSVYLRKLDIRGPVIEEESLLDPYSN